MRFPALSNSVWFRQCRTTKRRPYLNAHTSPIQYCKRVTQLQSGDATCSSSAYKEIGITRSGTRAASRYFHYGFEYYASINKKQIQRLDYISEMKRWEAKKDLEAPQIEDEMIEELDEITSSPQQELDEADYILAQEESELKELIASMEEEQDNMCQQYGSDDEDYDQLFAEYTTIEALQQDQLDQHMNPASADTDAMDMS